LQQDLDKDTGRRRGVSLIHLDTFKGLPVDGVGGEEMCKEFGEVPQLVGLESMDRGVLLEEDLVPDITKGVIETAKTFCEIAVERHVASFLCAARNNHVADFIFFSLADSLTKQLMGAFLKAETRHDRQIDPLSQGNEFCLCPVDHLD